MNERKKLIYTFIFFFSVHCCYAQIDSVKMDSVVMSFSRLIYTPNSTEFPKSLIQNTILPINSSNTMNLIAFAAGASRSQEFNSLLSIKGSGPYNNKLYLDDNPIKNRTHNYGFLHSLNRNAIESIQLLDGYIPANLNTAGGIISYKTITPSKESDVFKFNLTPLNVNANAIYKINKQSGLFLSYTTNALHNFKVFELNSFVNDYNDLHLIYDIGLTKINKNIKINILRFYERQHKENEIKLIGNYQGTVKDIYGLISIKNNKNNNHFWQPQFNILFNSNKLISTHLANTINVVENGIKISALNDIYKQKFYIGLDYEYQKIKLNDYNLSFIYNYNLASTFVKFNWKYKNLDFKTDFRINYFSIQSQFKVFPLQRTEILFKVNKKLEVVTSINTFSTGNFGVQNNLLPTFQDIQIPMWNVNTLLQKKEFNSKVLYKIKNASFQFFTCLSATNNIVDKQDLDPVKLDLFTYNFGQDIYKSIGLSGNLKLGSYNLISNLTFSKSKYYIENINNGLPYNSPQDRPIIFNLLFNKKLKNSNNMSIQFTFQSGRPITLPIGYLSSTVLIWSARNKFRTSSFHHLDFGCDILKKKSGKHLIHLLQLHCYNVYFKRNVYNVIFDYENSKLVELSLVPFLISLEYSITIF